MSDPKELPDNADAAPCPSRCSMAGCTLYDDGIAGAHGGQLEYAGQKMIVRKNETTGQLYWSVILYFTDHDKWGIGEPSISEEIYAHYAMEVPCSAYG